MQLLSTKQYYEQSTEYYKRPLLIDQVKSETETWQSSVVLRPIKDIELLEHLYAFNNLFEIKQFLLTHDYLINLLFEVYRQIKRVFGENIVEACLKYDRDPEEDFEGLFVIVKSNLSPEQALHLLDKFDEEWWLDVENEIRKVLEVDIETIS